VGRGVDDVGGFVLSSSAVLSFSSELSSDEAFLVCELLKFNDKEDLVDGGVADGGVVCFSSALELSLFIPSRNNFFPCSSLV
jgi:hypothetical protein